MRIFYISCLVLYCSYLHSQTFTNVAGSMGINHTYSKGFNGGGVSFCDFDYDGLEDIFFSSSLGQLIVMEKNYSNYFLNVISQYNITVIYESKTILIADYDNDGDRDIFIANFLGRNKLYRNTGSNFIDATASAGLSTDSLPSTAALWFDYNRDGLLDLYIGLYSGFGNNLNFPNHLYRNLGNGTFQYVSSSAGVSNTGNKVLAMAALDYNNDGWHDIYIASDRRIGNTMFKNNGNGTFTNVSSITNTNLEMDAMGLTIGDYDNNGYFDIYISNGEEGNAFLKNNGNGTFTDVAASLGMTVNRVCWGNNFIDYDNDADLDLYISVAQGNPDRKNKLFRNNGNGTFTLTSGIGLDNDNYESYGNAIGDFDNNGFSDIAVLNAHGDSVSLWKNSGGSNKWVKVKLIGTVSNKEAIGSILEVWRGSSKYVRYYGCGASYLSQNSSNIILGLGSSISIDSLFVRWPSGIINVFRNISSNQTVTLVEDGVIGIHNNNNNLPSEYKLFQNYPNPFNPSTVISYQLVVNSFVNLKVYDLLGSEVATLVNEQLKAGSYKVEWNGANYPGSAYFYRLIANDFTETKKMILIK